MECIWGELLFMSTKCTEPWRWGGGMCVRAAQVLEIMAEISAKFV